jgi:quinol monooxygenase YgiN
MKSKLLIILFSMALISSSYSSKKTALDSDGPANFRPTPLDENGMMIIAKLKVKADKVKAFTEAAKEIIEKSNKEAGCKFYQLYQDPYNNTSFVFVEEYKNQAAVDVHFASDYFKAFGPKIGDLVAEPTKIKIVTVAKEVNK